MLLLNLWLGQLAVASVAVVVVLLLVAAIRAIEKGRAVHVCARKYLMLRHTHLATNGIAADRQSERQSKQGHHRNTAARQRDVVAKVIVVGVVKPH